ncbi:ABC transporter permease [Janibacter sp. GXQ6167]|uniref:ABC transporter permease n=1 Tax=Janibacter sp. GXQ6167 TaxID=3240791 RepID=UPI0035259D3A
MTALAASPVSPAEGGRSPFAGTSTLVRFYLRLARVRILIWVLAVVALVGFGASELGEIYATPAERASRAALMSNPSAILLGGPGYGLDNYTLPVMLANEYTLLTSVLVAVMAIQLVTARLRGDEEAGRYEVLRAGVVGRAAPTMAALSTAAIACALLAGALFVILLATSIPRPADALAFSVGIGITGLVFGVLAATTSQLVEHARAASGIAYAALAGAFVLRGVGDIQERHGSWVSWTSPLAWPQQTRAWVDLRWWPLLLSLAVIAIGTAVALAGTRRDVGAGVLPTRPGRATARAWLASPFALAWRLQRTGIAWWALALALYSALCGSLVRSVLDQVATNPAIQVYLRGSGTSLTDTFVALMLAITVCAVGGWAVASVLRLRSSERDGHSEVVLASAVSRTRWLLQHLAVTLLGSTLLLAACGLALGASAAAVIGEPALTWRTLGGALAYLPAVMAMGGLAALLYGLAPSLTPFAWLPVAWSVIVLSFGGLLQLPGWVIDTSPIGWSPALPGDAMVWTPVVVLTVAALALVATATLCFRRRDLPA